MSTKKENEIKNEENNNKKHDLRTTDYRLRILNDCLPPLPIKEFKMLKP